MTKEFSAQRLDVKAFAQAGARLVGHESLLKYERLAQEALKTPLMDPESAYNSDTHNPTHMSGDDSKASSLVR